MKFQLVDKIEQIELTRRPDGTASGRIVTIKALSLAEEYLADHFPIFPVMPGVLMLEAMVESAAWLIRVAQGFSKSVIELKSARNVRYASFVSPGDVLRCEVEAVEIGPDESKFKGVGAVGPVQTVSGRLELRSMNLVGVKTSKDEADKAIIAQMREQFRLVGGPEAMERAGLQA